MGEIPAHVRRQWRRLNARWKALPAGDGSQASEACLEAFYSRFSVLVVGVEHDTSPERWTRVAGVAFRAGVKEVFLLELFDEDTVAGCPVPAPARWWVYRAGILRLKAEGMRGLVRVELRGGTVRPVHTGRDSFFQLCSALKLPKPVSIGEGRITIEPDNIEFSTRVYDLVWDLVDQYFDLDAGRGLAVSIIADLGRLSPVDVFGVYKGVELLSYSALVVVDTEHNPTRGADALIVVEASQALCVGRP